MASVSLHDVRSLTTRNINYLNSLFNVSNVHNDLLSMFSIVHDISESDSTKMIRDIIDFRESLSYEISEFTISDINDFLFMLCTD